MAVERFKTNELGLVAYLKLRGHSVQEVGFSEDRLCRWVFMALPTLLVDVDQYVSGEASVDPKEYNGFYAETKKEMFRAERTRA